jgi:hypothetical protein
MSDVEFQTIKSDEMKFGKNNFLEVARKKAVAEEGENEFIAISRGFYLPDGTKRFRRSLAIPDDEGLLEFITKKLKELHSTAKPKAAAKPAEEKPAEPAKPEAKSAAPAKEAVPAEKPVEEPKV